MMENENELQVVVDETVNVEITRDKMMGVISFTAPINGGRTLSFNEVLQEINQRGIVQGVNMVDLQELVMEKKYNYKYIIAKGTPAIDGKDAKINLSFDVEKLNNLRPRELEDGTVDFKDLDCVRNVRKGEILATKTPIVAGIDGVNVLGQVVRGKRGKDARLPRGKNTMITPDGLKLVAVEDGKLSYEGGNVSVGTVCLIPGDVDSSTGNIDFIGSVVVSGMVHNGFRIQAKGSVEVRGPVEGATIIAGGDIILSYGVQGTETSRLEAGGNIIAKFIQNAYIQAEKDIITEGIWHSTVNAGGIIKVDVGKGCIIGGNISATNVVSARNIGSPMGAVTDIQIGIKPCVYTEYKELANAIQKEKKELTDVEKEILFIKTRNVGVPLDQFKQRRLERLMEDRARLFEQLQEDQNRYAMLTERVESVKDGVVEVSNKIYPGSKITIGNTTMNIDTIHSRCAFVKTGQDITTDMLMNIETATSAIPKKKRADAEEYIEDQGVIHYTRV